MILFGGEVNYYFPDIQAVKSMINMNLNQINYIIIL